MDRLPLYLTALIVSLANVPSKTASTLTAIYRVATFDLDTASARRWRDRVVSALRAVLAILWPHRQRIATVALLGILLLTAPTHLHAGGSMLVIGHLAQLETDLKAKTAAAKELLEKTMRAAADTVVVAATATTQEVKGRVMTTEEKAAVQVLLDEAKGIKARIDGHQNDAAMMDELNKLTGTMPNSPAHQQHAQRTLKSLGAQFIADPNYRAWIKAEAFRQRGSISPLIELQGTTFDTTSGSGGALITPDYQPGFVPLLTKRLVVADLIAPGTTDGNLISYMKEKTFMNAAAAVAQGATKPESTLIFEPATSAVQKIAHWIPVTEEMLEDYAQTQSVIDARLRLGLSLAEEDELLNGSGVSPHLLGLMSLTGLTAAQARGADTNMDAIFKQMTTIATTVFVLVDGIVINPTNWQAIQLLKNAAGNYMGSGPWAAAQTPILWGVPAAVTPSIVANTALVGGWRSSAQYFRKGGIRVEASNSHSDFFVKNLVAIRGEQRGALAVYREAAFGKVTGLN